jgi:hypothetical protein
MVDISLLNKLYSFVILTTKKFNIDESHSLGHSMKVFNYANKIYESEVGKNPFLQDHHKIICVSSILHDMCDKKYMDENYGKTLISDYIKDLVTPNELDITLKIISTMSYSTVKKNGFPSLGKYQLAYNIVREADLLDSYDFERCMIYQMLRNNDTYDNSLNNALKLFDIRVLKYLDDNLFTTEYGKLNAYKLHKNAIVHINKISKIGKK